MSPSRDEKDENERLHDVRTVERHMRRGQISRKDFERHLKGLPDVADKGEVVTVDPPILGEC